ncbi:pseudaminic acid synthase [Psychrobacter okhotskensis]|uniref:pseudaminic acid synthase n=1 Tax=Psychrobacter okhotskensis TaxID=212403 RepID=UPI0019186832|nr:pseudaminic acid synthase [Psychrobacter okhotskensis]
MLEINGRKIGKNFPPYIIAEMSANHNGDINNAFKIIEMAKRSGADAVKLQTYTPDTITFDSKSEDFMIRGGLWDGKSLYDLYKSAYMPWDWHKPIFEKANAEGITIFSSPFDFTAVDLLEDLNAPAYKIASFEAIDIPLIKYVASTGKPMIISTGMANEEEISEAIEAAQSSGCKQLVILHCVSSYPAEAEDYNLKTILDMQQRYGCLVGLSDHTISNTTAIASVALGACVIEKHVTLDRTDGGPDDSFSLEEPELKDLCQFSKEAYYALGEVNYGLKSNEKSSVKFRRSLYIVKDIKAGEVIDLGNVRSIRPGYGVSPKFLEDIVGSTSKVDIKAGTPFKWDFINNE